jgi:hypothetical protein
MRKSRRSEHGGQGGSAREEGKGEIWPLITDRLGDDVGIVRCEAIIAAVLSGHDR